MKKSTLMSLSPLFLLFCSVASAQAGDWELRMVPFEGGWAAIKFNVESGDCYYASSGNWLYCGEEGGRVRSGEYEVTVIGVGTSWYAIRMNTETGRSWRLSAGDWHDMEEDGERGRSDDFSSPELDSGG